MTNKHKLVIYIAAAATVVFLTAMGAKLFKKRKYESGYARVQIGDSQQVVTESLGEPSAVESCYSPGTDDECAIVSTYYSFMEKWCFAFNRDGKVIDKWYN